MSAPEDDLDRYLDKQTPEFQASVRNLMEIRRQIELLYEARHHRGISLDAVAEATDSIVSDIEAIESGKVSPSIELIERYARAIGYRFSVSVEPVVD